MFITYVFKITYNSLLKEVPTDLWVTAMSQGYESDNLLWVRAMSQSYESPKSCEVLGIGFFDFEKMTFLEIFDMYLFVFVIFSQYLVIHSQYLLNI